MYATECLRRCLMLAAIFTFASLATAEDKPEIKVAEHMVAMSDGVKLATDVYLPGDGSGKYPVIVARTPYNKAAGGKELSNNTGPRGYAFVYQDMRGRFRSEGKPVIIFGNDG